MTNKKDLMLQYMLKFVDVESFQREPKYLTANDLLTALWPFNDNFKMDIESIKALPYQPELEIKADLAIEGFINTGVWLASLEVKRVLLERHSQAITGLTAQSIGKPAEPIFPVPDTLPEAALTGVVIVHLLYQMTLPFPVNRQ